MRLGSERLLDSPRLRGLRVGIVANPASIDRQFHHITERLGSSSDYRLTFASSDRGRAPSV